MKINKVIMFWMTWLIMISVVMGATRIAYNFFVEGREETAVLTCVNETGLTVEQCHRKLTAVAFNRTSIQDDYNTLVDLSTQCVRQHKFIECERALNVVLNS